VLGIQSILPHVPAFGLVLARLTGLFVFSPILGSVSVPRRFKALLTLVLALAVYPTIDHSKTVGVSMGLFSLGPMLITEALIGATIGVLMLTPMWAVQLAGTLMGQQMGLSLAPVFNPATDFESDELGQLLFMMALAVFVAAGGIESLWEGLVRSFATVAPGSFRVDHTLLETATGLVSSGFHLGMRVAMPVMAIVLVESIAVGFISKSLPQLNPMSFGFPVRILLGLVTLTASLAGVMVALGYDVRSTIQIVSDWVSGVSGG